MELSPFENNLFLLLFLATVIHSFYLGILLLIKSQKERGLGWLGSLMFPVSLWMLTYLLYIADAMRTNPHLLGVFAPVLYLMGPMYYYFIRRSTNQDHQFKWYDSLHLLPLSYTLWEWWPIYGWPIKAKLAVIERVYSNVTPELSQVLLSDRNSLLFLGYVLFCIFILQLPPKQERINPLRIHWLKRFSLILLSILLLKLLLPPLFWVFGWDAAIFELTTVLLLAISVHILGYVVLAKDRVLPKWMLPNVNPKYATSPLHSDQIKASQKQLLQYLETDRPWLAPDFSIAHLAKAINIPRHHLSQIFSEGLQMSFYDLINAYRIEEVKRRLKAGDTQTYSMQGIAADCGFGSKSSFNRAFKKEEGMPPSKWLAMHKQ